MPDTEEELLRRQNELFTLIDSFKALEIENARLRDVMAEFRRAAQYDRDDARRAREERDALRVEVAALRRKVGVPTELMIASARAYFAETKPLSLGCPA